MPERIDTSRPVLVSEYSGARLLASQLEQPVNTRKKELSTNSVARSVALRLAQS